jgi:hypothetical protein
LWIVEGYVFYPSTPYVLYAAWLWIG